MNVVLAVAVGLAIYLVLAIIIGKVLGSADRSR
jgi:hypothetical protein